MIDSTIRRTRNIRGSLRGAYTYVGTYQVTVPAGSYKAVLLRLKCEGKVGPAHTHDTAYYFFAPGKGVVAMISQEDATAFWIIHIDTTSGKVLIANRIARVIARHLMSRRCVRKPAALLTEPSKRTSKGD